MKKTKYNKPAIIVLQISMQPILLSASEQQIGRGRSNINNERTINGEEDFI